jgi:maltose O-acetyltransferase
MNLIIKYLLKLGEKFKLLNYKRKMKNCINNGLLLGRNITIMPGAYIDPRYSFLISIGDNCSISNGVLILARDASPYKFTGGYTRLGKVEIKENCYIGSNVIILPGVTIGPNVLIAAGSVVNKSIPPNSCVAGVPARVYSPFDENMKHHEEMIKLRPSFDYKEFNLPDNKFKNQILELSKEGAIYVRGFEGKFPWTNSE